MTAVNTGDGIIGSWTLLSWRRIGPAGDVSWPHTQHGTGRLIYSPGNLMAGFLMAPGHAKGQQDDAQPLFVGYSGRFEIVDDIACHHVDFASDTRMLHKVLRRRIEWISGDQLRLHTLAAQGAPARDSRHELVWQRD